MNEIHLEGKRIWAYYRVSTDMQDFARQRHNVREFVEQNGGYILNEVIDPGVSSTKIPMMKREGLKKVLDSAISGKFDVLVVTERDRLARKRPEHQIINHLLKESGIVLYLSNEEQIDNSPTGQLIEAVLQARTEFESLKTSARLKSMRAAKRAKGQYAGAGSNLPFGYRYCKELTEKIKIIEDEALCVKLIYDYFIKENLAGNNVGYTTIAKLLNSLGIERPGQYPVWNYGHIKNILINSFYCGLPRHFKITEDGTKTIETYECDLVPAIVSREDYLKVQEIINSKNIIVPEIRHEIEFLLKELAYCSDCGKRLGPISSYSKDRKRVDSSYRCKFAGDTGNCTGVYISKRKLESPVWEEVKAYIATLDLNKLLDNLEQEISMAINSYNNNIKKLMKVGKHLEKNIADIVENIEKGKELAKIEEEKIIEWNRELNEVNLSIARVQLEKENLKNTVSDKKEQLHVINRALENLDELTFGEKRAIVQSIIQKVTVDRKQNINVIFKEICLLEKGQLTYNKLMSH